MKNQLRQKCSTFAAVTVIVLGTVAYLSFPQTGILQPVILSVIFCYFNFRAWLGLIEALQPEVPKGFICKRITDKLCALSMLGAGLVLLEKEQGLIFMASCFLYALIGYITYRCRIIA